MKASLHFNLPEDQNEFEAAVAAGRMKALLWDIAQEIFRPARKHGYPDISMKKFTDENGELADNVAEAIGVLEEKFYEMVREYSIDLD